MANEEKLDFTQEPIIIELGYSVLPIVTIAENKKIFLSSLEQFREIILEREHLKLPAIHIEDNMKLHPKQYRILIYGKNVCDVKLIDLKNLLQNVLRTVQSELEHNLFYFKNDFIIDSQKLEEMFHEQSREVYQFLFRYYSNIEPNKNQAFHWLKKKSYYGIPQDIRKLAHFYNIGEGCEQDQIQFEKLRELLNPNSYSKRKF